MGWVESERDPDSTYRAMPRIDPGKLDEHYATLTYEVGIFMMEHLRRINREFRGDFALAMVLGEIAHHNTRQLVREVIPRSGKSAARFAKDEPLDAHFRRCNALSVAEASGIPRETVRRKVAKLEDMGLVERDESGGLAITRKVGRHFRGFDRETMVELVALAEKVRTLAGK